MTDETQAVAADDMAAALSAALAPETTTTAAPAETIAAELAGAEVQPGDLVADLANPGTVEHSGLVPALGDPIAQGEPQVFISELRTFEAETVERTPIEVPVGVTVDVNLDTGEVANVIPSAGDAGDAAPTSSAPVAAASDQADVPASSQAATPSHGEGDAEPAEAMGGKLEVTDLDPASSPEPAPAVAASATSGHCFQALLSEEEVAAWTDLNTIIAKAHGLIDGLTSHLGLTPSLDLARSHLNEALTHVQRHLNGDG